MSERDFWKHLNLPQTGKPEKLEIPRGEIDPTTEDPTVNDFDALPESEKKDALKEIFEGDFGDWTEYVSMHNLYVENKELFNPAEQYSIETHLLEQVEKVIELMILGAEDQETLFKAIEALSKVREAGGPISQDKEQELLKIIMNKLKEFDPKALDGISESELVEVNELIALVNRRHSGD